MPRLAIIGTGAAGLMAACVAAELVPVVVLTDRGIGTSNSAVAQGGLQLPLDDSESLERFRRDITRSAGPNVDADRLEGFLAAVRPTVKMLEEWGLQLDRTTSGELVRRIAGGLSEPRVVTAGDRIGTAVLRVLRAQARKRELDIVTQTRIVDIHAGAQEFELVTEQGEVMAAEAVIVAIGGRSFEHARTAGVPTSNPANTNTTLYSAVRRLGIAEIDPDLFQYQPYGIVDPVEGVTGKCVPESVVELGARVVDAQGRTVARELADRRELTEAMFTAMAGPTAERSASDEPVLRLTVGSVPSGELTNRFPHLVRTYERARLPNGDLHVVPVVHYQLGGFAVAPDGSTTVPGLYLAGEMTGGLHGRNRLMGNGITEAIVDGYLAGSAAATLVRDRSRSVR